MTTETIGTTLLKMSNGFQRPMIGMAALLCYGFSLYLISLLLRNVPVGIVYAIWSGVGIVLISIINWLVIFAPKA